MIGHYMWKISITAFLNASLKEEIFLSAVRGLLMG